MRTMKHLMLATAAAAALALAGCGGGGSSPSTAMEQEQTPYQKAVAEIAAATTAAEAQAAYDAVKGDVTAAQGDMLQAAVEARKTALTMAAAAEARQALVDAAMCDAATDECVAAHDALIMALQGDVDALADNEDATNAEQTDAQMALDNAKEARAAVAMALANDMRDTETGMKVTTAEMAANGLEDERSAEDIAAAEEAIAAAEMAIAEGDDPEAFMAEIGAAKMAVARAKARNAVDMAVMEAETYSAMLTDDQSKAAVEVARMKVEAAKKAVMDNAEALTDADEAGFNAQITLAEAPIGPLESQIATMETEAEKTANAAMAATAAKLYAGISAPVGAHGTYADDDRIAGYDTDGTAIEVQIGSTPVAIAATATLSVEKTAVADNHGWTGQKFTEEPENDGTYEAVVYSKVGDPTEGDPFNDEYTLNAADATNPGELPITGAQLVPERIASSSFDQEAGTKEFELGSNLQRVAIPGSYHGVSGTYYCEAATDSTCAVQLAADDGFNLGGTDEDKAFAANGGSWTFKPTSPTAKVMSTPSTDYASYGWWLHTSEDGNTVTASAFVDDRGTVDDAAGITTLRGTATYMGGAAGKYALSSSTGGTNDAGHFIARATLDANFNNDTIKGTIDNFMGVGGAKDWSVELMESGIGDNGLIREKPAADATIGASDEGAMTQWTIGGTAATADGEWTGSLKDNGDDGVPKVGTGTFYTEYGSDGKMVGAFGVDKQ